MQRNTGMAGDYPTNHSDIYFELALRAGLLAEYDRANTVVDRRPTANSIAAMVYAARDGAHIEIETGYHKLILSWWGGGYDVLDVSGGGGSYRVLGATYRDAREALAANFWRVVHDGDCEDFELRIDNVRVAKTRRRVAR